MLNYYFANTALVYIMIGFACTLVLYFACKKDFVGNFWLVLIIGIIGSFLGAIMEFFLGNIIEALTKVSGHINIFPPIISAGIIVYIYHKVSGRRGK